MFSGYCTTWISGKAPPPPKALGPIGTYPFLFMYKGIGLKVDVDVDVD